MERVKLSRLETALADLNYPLTRADAATTLQGTTLVHPDGEGDLGEFVSETGADAFDHPDDVVAALDDVLARSFSDPGRAGGDG